MDKQKATIWFLGSNSVGKTTQSALFHLYMRDIYGEPNYQSQVIEVQENDIKTFYTKLSPVSANLGIFIHPLTTQDKSTKTTACCGTDRLSTKAQIELAYQAALADPDVLIITVEAIMATGQFINFLANDESKLMTVLLDCHENTNFKRLAQRRGKKLGIDPSEVIISDRTKENLGGKLRGFRATFERVKPKSDFAVSISTDILSIDDIFKNLLNSFLCRIL